MTTFIINLSKKNQNTGYLFYINNILKLNKQSKVVSIDIITTKNLIQRLFIFSPLNIIFQIFNLLLKKNTKVNYKYVLCTMPNYLNNIYLIRKKSIKTFLMIDCSFDYYSNHKTLFFLKYFSFLAEELLLFSGLKTIILNSDFVVANFKNRHKLSLDQLQIEVVALPIWFEINNHKQIFSNENNIIVYGNFLFKPNLDGLYFILDSIIHPINLNITFIGINSNLKNYNTLIELIKIKFNNARILPTVSNSDLEYILFKSNFVIIPGTKAEGIKIKIIEALILNKIVLAHKNIVKFIGFEYENLVVYENNLEFILNNLNNYKLYDNKKIIEHYSFTSKRQEVIDNYF